MKLLAGKQIFVAGATGEVGSGAVIALVQVGATVYAGGRNQAKLETLKTKVLDDDADHIVPIVADYSTVEGAKALERLVQDLTFDSVIASSGPWWPVNHQLTKVQDLEIFGKASSANLQAHMLLYRILAPKTKDHYIAINGAAAKGLPHTGLTGIFAHAMTGFGQVAHWECLQSNGTLPQFTHCLLSSSVGHGHVRGQTHKPEEYGRAFVAMVLGKHEVDDKGTVNLDDALYEYLSGMV